MSETRETILFCVAIYFACRAISAGSGKTPPAEPTELDRLPFTAKVLAVAIVGALAIGFTFLIRYLTDLLFSWLVHN